MNKGLVALLIILGLSSCSKNEHYYQTHPKELQQAISTCPEKQSQGLTCNQLEVLAKRMNELAYQLQLSPQGFGKKIMALQEVIVKEQEQLKTQGNHPDLRTKLTRNKYNLEAHLAIVRWFESPMS